MNFQTQSTTKIKPRSEQPKQAKKFTLIPKPSKNTHTTHIRKKEN